MTFSEMMRKASAYLPVAMSAAALALVIGFLAIFGIVHQEDEGTTAHLFQLLIAGQVPIVAWFAIRWLPEAPKPALMVLVLQAGAALMALLPVFLLEM